MPVVPMFTRPCAVATPRSSGVSSKVANGRLADRSPSGDQGATPNTPQGGYVSRGCGSGFAGMSVSGHRRGVSVRGVAAAGQ